MLETFAFSQGVKKIISSDVIYDILKGGKKIRIIGEHHRSHTDCASSLCCMERKQYQSVC